MKAKQETIGMINFINGIGEGQTILVNKKQYIFKCVATSRVDVYHTDYYFIVLDSKGNMQVLDQNTLVTIL